MGIYHGNDLRKITGGLKGRTAKKKRKALTGGYPILTTIGQKNEIKVVKATGETYKAKVKQAMEVNVYIPKEKKTVKTKITKFIDNPSNKDLARRGIITKGAIVQTEIGKAVITSRPGQDGVLNAVLVEQK
ncbi:30S ribosomal protein S8e [Thermofilum sp.]|jgi:small subunit ribosomal protein S8e|uniref:30S ribosomal protein S8e n=2 Tax=Thermofilum sp. TaxID=1961369 RepID=UPI00259057E2|nr:30S ribosomal protein S8e [Thermofilum sp.]